MPYGVEEFYPSRKVKKKKKKTKKKPKRKQAY